MLFINIANGNLTVHLIRYSLFAPICVCVCVCVMYFDKK